MSAATRAGRGDVPRRALAAFALLVLFGGSLAADRLELDNGDVVSGTIVRMDEELVVVESEYGLLEIRRDRIVRGEFVGNSEPDEGDGDGEASGLIFHFPLDGTLDDRTGTYTLTNNGLVFTEDHEENPESALYSDGTGTYLSLPPSTELNELDDFTLAFRIRLDEDDGTSYLISKWDRAEGQNAEGKFTIQNSNGGLTLFLVGPDGRYRWLTARGVLTPDRWHTVAVTFAGGEATIYVDGSVVRNRSFAFTELSDDDSPFLIMTAVARNDEPYAYYNAPGAIDAILLYGRALSAEEVAALSSDTVQADD